MKSADATDRHEKFRAMICCGSRAMSERIDRLGVRIASELAGDFSNAATATVAVAIHSVNGRDSNHLVALDILESANDDRVIYLPQPMRRELLFATLPRQLVPHERVENPPAF